MCRSGACGPRGAGPDAAAGVERDLAALVAQLRARRPETRIVLRTDSGFCREPILAWCEAHAVDYVIGLAKNAGLQQRVAVAMRRSLGRAAMRREPSRRFRSFRYRIRTSWSRQRRVIAKVEALPGAGAPMANPRFLVTSLPAATHPARDLHENFYCAREDKENRVKEHQLDLFARRCSSNLFNANMLRLYLSTFAYVLLGRLRRALAGTRLARARPETIRWRLLRIGARVRTSVRRLHVAMASACPERDLFIRAWHALAPP